MAPLVSWLTGTGTGTERTPMGRRTDKRVQGGYWVAAACLPDSERFFSSQRTTDRYLGRFELLEARTSAVAWLEVPESANDLFS